MKKITALVLALIILTMNIFFTVSCKEEVPEEPPGEETPGGNGGNEPENKDDEDEPTIKVPEYKDYLRGSVDFTDIVYSRPNIDAAVTLLASLCEMIDKNELSYEEQMTKIAEIDPVYTNLLSMNAVATIYNYKDSSNQFWNEEFSYISTNYPKFSQAVEKLFVSAANSPYIEQFEADYFGDGLEEYKDGGIYTDRAVELMSEEAAYESEYSSISTANVTITYKNTTDTYDNIIAYYAETYGASSTEYLKAKSFCDILYKDKLSELQSELLVKLIKVRKLISNELGYDSYEQFAYETLYHDYEPKKMRDFIDDVTNYAIPVYLSLSNKLIVPFIYDYEKTNIYGGTDRTELVNTLYDIYTANDAKLGEIYSYMLQHKLYDIENDTEYRFDGAFTTYIESNASPFLFVTLDNSILDYATLAHEFGHFADNYINNGASTSLDLAEVYSQALELLTLIKLRESFDTEAYKYLSYMKLDEIFGTLIFQSFYASFEIAAYELEYDDITLENLNKIVAKNAEKFGISSSWNSVEYIMIPHLFMYPFYVQSYGTSGAVALEIYSLELESLGSGFTAYNALLNRNGAGQSFEESLESAGLTSPFDDDALKTIANDIHYLILGANYFTNSNNNAA